MRGKLRERRRRFEGEITMMDMIDLIQTLLPMVISQLFEFLRWKCYINICRLQYILSIIFEAHKTG